MSDEGRENHDDAFGQRLGRLLRRPERLDGGFEQELVAAIRSDRPVEREPMQHRGTTLRSWWVSPMLLRVRPLVGLPIAASIVALIVLALSAPHAARQSSEPAPAIATRVVHDTVSVVRFVFVGAATRVSLVGDFNAWGARPVELRSTGANAWSVSLPLLRGRYEYAFIVDGTRWVADPFAPMSIDEFNTNSSVITVGT